MKYIISGLIITTIALGAWYIYRLPKVPPVSKPDTVKNDDSLAITPEESKQHIIAFNGKQYRYIYYIVAPHNIPNTTVISNPKQATMKRLAQEHHCTAAINGGFYTSDGAPLGLLTHDSKEEREANSVSTLLDGFWYLLNDGTAAIARSIPSSGVAEALQNGPLLIEQGVARNLTITDDKYARRSLIAHTTDGAVVFITIFFPTSQLEGPLLAQLPQLLTAIGETEKLAFESALNLDGGSASGIITPDEHLSEFTNVGSIVCVL